MRRLAYHASRILCKLLLTPFVRIHLIRPEMARKDGGWILAANHISHFDPPLISVAGGRKIDWMAMVELFENAVTAAWLRAIDSFPVDRSHVDRRAVRTALERLRRGNVLGMFPEGGIRDGAHSVLSGAPIRPGVGAIAQMSGTPVLPVVILGSDRLYAPKSWVPGSRIPIWIVYGREQLRCEDSGKSARESFEGQLGNAFRELYDEAREQFGLSDADLPQPPMRRKGRV